MIFGFSATYRYRAQSKTLPRKIGGSNGKSGTGSRSGNGSSLILPPPPQYKGVHFAPGLSSDASAPAAPAAAVPPLPRIPSDPLMIPTEGLPTRPAPKKGAPTANAAADHIIVADSVTIRLNNRRAKEEGAMKPKPPPPKRIRWGP